MSNADAGSPAEQALRESAALGEFFEVAVLDRPGSAADRAAAEAAGWIGLRALADDPIHARTRVANARHLMVQRLGLDPSTVSERVMASIVFLGLAARLIAPPMGAVVGSGRWLELGLDDVWWQPVAGGAMPLLVHPGVGWTDLGAPDPSAAVSTVTAADAGEAATLLVGRTVPALIEPMVLLFGREFSLSDTVLWGNVASGVAGAAISISMAAPALATPAARLATAMLQLGPLSATARVADPELGNWGIQRRSCCLFYRVPGAGTCGDCVLNTPGRGDRNARPT